MSKPYPNMSIRDLYDRQVYCLGIVEEINMDATFDEVNAKDMEEAADVIVELQRIREEMRMSLVTAGLMA